MLLQVVALVLKQVREFLTLLPECHPRRSKMPDNASMRFGKVRAVSGTRDRHWPFTVGHSRSHH
eukprot:10231957-Alexandrium_andersonii.AAC.1